MRNQLLSLPLLYIIFVVIRFILVFLSLFFVTVTICPSLSFFVFCVVVVAAVTVIVAPCSFHSFFFASIATKTDRLWPVIAITSLLNCFTASHPNSKWNCVSRNHSSGIVLCEHHF
jgi:hypothetical protein